MAQNNLFLSPKSSAVGISFPGNFKDLLSSIAEHMGIGGSAKSISFGSSTPAVEDQDKPWLKLNGDGISLGWHIYTGTKWEPIEPIGKISLWNGPINEIPVGWILCDGVGTYLDKDGNSQPVPDFRDKFIVGSGNTYSQGDTGGQDTFTITAPNLPTGNIINIPPSGSHLHSNGSGGNIRKVGGVANGSLASQGAEELVASGDHSHTGNITGASDTPIDNKPLYLAKAYILYTAV